MLDLFRNFIRGLGQMVWYGVIGLCLLGLVLYSLTREGSNISPQELQITLDAASTEANQYVPTLAAQLTQTQPQSMLTGAAPTIDLIGRQEYRQHAAAAIANNERDKVNHGAVQAAGPPNVLEGECVDSPAAWATVNPTDSAVLTLYYPELITPTGVMIYQNFNPGYVVRVDLVDVYGEAYTVYEATPQPAFECPFRLVIPIIDADYLVNTIKIYLDQSANSGQANQIDAVELIGVK